jgi:hypothetical protein
MSESRPRASTAEVNQSIREIRDYHKQGRASLRKLPERGGYGGKAIAEQAKRLGWNATRLRKARQFAMQYTQTQLNELCKLVREHQPHFGTAHVGILVTVPDAQQRSALQAWCITEDVSKVELEREVKKRFGARRFGGRRRQVADDPTLVLLQIDEMADSWARWYAIASEEPAGNGQTESVLDRLPESVRVEARKVDRAVRRLRDAVADELEQARANQ